MNPIRTVLVDDEPLALESLRELISAEPELVIEGAYRSGSAFLREAAIVRPDLLFLDVEMPRLSGFDVLEQLHAAGLQPSVVFVTAFDQYAVRAFEEEAIDYVVKPYQPERLARAVARVREQLALQKEPEPYLTRVAVKRGEHIHLVRIDDVDWAESASNYVRLHVGPAGYLFRTTMANFAQRLDPARFVRIHRSMIVNIERVAELQPTFGRDFALILRDGTRLKLSAQYRAELARLIDGL